MTVPIHPPSSAGLPRSGAHCLLHGGTPDFTHHLNRFGPLPANPSSLARLLDDAGLVGRGGAGFPAGRKLAGVVGRNAVVIANGAEGEPASRKDAALLATTPHLVLDGLTLVGAALNAREVHLYAPAQALPAIRRAISERRARGCNDRPVQLTEAPDTFVAGEKSAVISRLEGRSALPRDHVARNAVAGLRGRPTLLHNVETLAHIALIARFGAAWFRSRGTPTEPGTMLVTLSGAGRAEQVVEVPLGIPLTDLVADTADLRAVLVGGFHGAWIPAATLPHTELSRESMIRHNATPGAGVVRALAADQCGLQASADIVAYLADQSAGQCGPCINGLPQIARALTNLAYGSPRENLDREVLRLANLVDGRGSCAHPDGTARFVRSALRTFADDVSEHLEGHCAANQPETIGGRVIR